MKRKIIYIILALIFFLGAVTFYINQVTIPRHLKKVITLGTEKYLGRRIILKDIHFNPLKGFVADEIVIFEKNSDDVFATIGRATVGIRYLPFIFYKRIVLSSFEVNKVSAHLIHYAEDEWNFSDIIEEISSRPKSSSSKAVPVYMSRIRMADGKIKVTDLEAGSQSSELFENADVRADLSLSRGVILHLSTNIPQQQGWVEIKGRYHLFNKRFKGQLKMKNIPLAQYLKMARQELPFTLQNVYVNDASVTVDKGPEGAEAQGFGNIKDLDLKLSTDNAIQAKTFVLQRGEFSINKGQTNANGICWVKDAKVNLGPKVISASGAKAELTGLSIENNTFFAAGSASLEKASVEAPGAPAFAGDVALDDVRVSQKDDQWTTTGRVQAQKASVAFSPETKLAGDFSSPFLTVTIAPKSASVKGTIETKDLFLQWPQNKELRGEVVFQNVSVTGNDGQWSAEGSLTGHSVTIKLPNEQTFSTEAAASLSLKAQTSPRKADVHSNFKLTQSVFTMKNGTVFKGDPAGQLEIRADDKPDTEAAYEGSFYVENAVLNGTPIGDIGAIKGNIAFKNGQASSNDLTFNALGMAAGLKGKLLDYSRPSVDVKIRVDQFDLLQAPKIVPRFFEQNKLSVDGPAEDVDISYRGLIGDATDADIRFNANLKDASASSAKFNQSASKLSGRIDYKKDYFAWKNLKAFYRNRNYVLTGRMTDFKSPLVETNVASRNLKMTVHFNYTPEVTTIRKLTGAYERMVFDVKGTSRSSSDGQPLLDLSGDADIELKYLMFILPQWADTLTPYKLDGELKVKGQFTGDPVHWQDWRFNLTGSASQFFMWGLKVRSLRLTAIQKDNRLKPLHVTGNFYGGELNAIATIDFAKKDLPFDLILKIANADIGQLKADTPLKKSDMAGKLSSTALMEGSIGDLKAVEGKGGIQIEEGRLWELDLLKGLGGILLIPEYKGIVFNEAGMNFMVKDGLVSTENLQLLSPSLRLIGRGTMDFNQNLNLILAPDFNSDVIAGSSSIKKGTTAIITQTEKFMTVDVSGTLTKPQYKVNKSPGRILQKTGGIILDNVSGFFKNMF